MIYKIAVIASSSSQPTRVQSRYAFELGREIARCGAALVVAASPGIVQHVARGAKSKAGQTIGLSPAINRQAHVRKYNLPTTGMDLIIYTGLDFAARNTLLSSAADAVITLDHESQTDSPGQLVKKTLKLL